MEYKFKKLDKATLDSFNRLLSEYQELTGSEISDDVFCTSIVNALSEEVRQTLILRGVDVMNRRTLSNELLLICNASDKVNNIITRRTVNAQEADVEMNFHQTKPMSSFKKPVKNKKLERNKLINGKMCMRCGRNDCNSNKCPAKNAECSFCKKSGHYERVCKSKQRENMTSHNLNVVSIDSNEAEEIEFLSLHNCETIPTVEETALTLSHQVNSVVYKDIVAIADSGCTKPLFPKSMASMAYNTSIISNVVETAFNIENRVSTECSLDIIVKDITGRTAKVTIRGNLSESEGRFLLPARRLNTDAPGQEYIRIDEYKIKIYPHENPKLWGVPLKIIRKNSLISDVKEDILHLETEERAENTTIGCKSFSLHKLNKLGIFPLLQEGSPLTVRDITLLTPLWVQTMHVRLLHYGPEALHRFLLHEVEVDIPTSRIRECISTCKACVCKVTYKNPSKTQSQPHSDNISNRKKRRKANYLTVRKQRNQQQEKDTDEDINMENSDLMSNEEENLDTVEFIQSSKDKFNYVLYQDSIHLPLSINKNKCASIIVDHATSLCSVRPMQTASAEDSLQAFLVWQHKYGTPFSVQTDNGTEFDGVYHEHMMKHGVYMRNGIVARPQQQGLVERLNRELKQHTSLHLRCLNLPETCWEWALYASAFVHNRIPLARGRSPMSLSRKVDYSIRLWPGDRVAFKPRGTSIMEEDPSMISKLLVGRFQGFLSGKKALISILTPESWLGILVAKEELRQLPITLTDCIQTVQIGFGEPMNIDLAVSLASSKTQDLNKPVSIVDMPAKEVTLLHSLPVPVSPSTLGKTHLEVSKEELQAGTHNEAILKEFKSFIKNEVFKEEISFEQAKKEGYEIVSFKGIPSWKLKGNVRVAKWRGVCRGFQDHWIGEVDTDTPPFSIIRISFLIGFSRGLKELTRMEQLPFCKSHVHQRERWQYKWETTFQISCVIVSDQGACIHSTKCYMV